MQLSCFSISYEGPLAIVELCRPKEFNAMNMKFWKECSFIFRNILPSRDVRCVVLKAEGKHFSSGLDLNDPPKVFASETAEIGRFGLEIKSELKHVLQEAFTAIEDFKFPVIAAVHGACIGGALNLISACDIRYACSDAFFSVKEVDLGLACDLGALQRVPKFIGHGSWFRELCYTGRNFDSKEALEKGFISAVFDNHNELIRHSIRVGNEICLKSPIALVGIKASLNFSRDHSIADGLDHIATWNALMLQSQDLKESFLSKLKKKVPSFPKL